jgi:hypothetical protein
LSGLQTSLFSASAAHVPLSTLRCGSDKNKVFAILKYKIRNTIDSGNPRMTS